ncbi:MAG: M23 family metallopeptidase [Chlorobi bacterium]|nr:M23 family metallopeptidase [Chlorobiota bacterium]
MTLRRKTLLLPFALFAMFGILLLSHAATAFATTALREGSFSSSALQATAQISADILSIAQSIPEPFGVRASERMMEIEEEIQEIIRLAQSPIPSPTADSVALLRTVVNHQQALYEMLMLVSEQRRLNNQLPILIPCDGRYSSPFGMRVHPIKGVEKMHTGIDIAAPHGTEIFSANGGVVTFAGWRNGYGNTVEIDHGFGYVTRYAHASKLLAAAGDTVTRGALIARVGATGSATGAHLHYEIFVDGEQVDPAVFLLYREPVVEPTRLVALK